MANQNKSIGRFHFDEIPPFRRGIPKIEVTFDIDANGILNVTAVDQLTEKTQQIRIEASSGLSAEDILRMKDEALQHAGADKEMKGKVDKGNRADMQIFQTEKQLKEFGDTIPSDKKAAIENALEELKSAHKNRNFTDIEQAMATLSTVCQLASEELMTDDEEIERLGETLM